MGRRKRIVAWTLVAVGALLVAFLAAAVLLPRLVGLESVKRSILAAASRRMGGSTTYDRMELVLFPRPGLVVRNAGLSVPGRAIGTSESLAVYPTLLPLLAGRFRPARIDATNPSFDVPLPARLREPGAPPLSLAEVETKIASLLAEAASAAPGLAFSVTGGRLDLSRDGRTLFSFRDVDGRVELAPRALTAHVACRSSFFERLSATARLDPGAFKGQGKIALGSFRPRDLAAWLVPGHALPGAESVVDLAIAFRADGIGVLEGDVEGSAPSLELSRGDRRRTLKSVRFSGTVREEPGKTAVSIRELAVGSPKLDLAGRLLLDRAAPRVEIEAGVRNADLSSLRDVALGLAGDVPAVQRIFDVVRGGRVPSGAVRISAGSARELGRPENIVASARVADGSVHVPGVDLDLASAAGDVSFARGILEGRRLSARLGNSLGRDGSLTLGLAGTRRVFRLDTKVHADLSELPPLLSRLIRTGTFHDELAGVEEVRGEADGRLVLGDDTTSVRARVEVTEMRLSGRYKRLPFPVAISGGRFVYDGEAISLDEVAGTVGGSSATGLAARLRLGAEPSIEELSGNLSLDLGELYPWLASLKEEGYPLDRIEKLEGRATLSLARLRGPLRGPGKWDYAASGEVRNLAAVTADVPGDVTVEDGKFRAAPDSLSFTDVRGRLLDAALSVSGSLRGPAGGVRRYDLSLAGSVGPDAADWVSDLVRLPREFRVRPPVSLSGARLSRADDGATSFSGTLAFPEGPVVALSLRKDAGGLAIDNLAVRDAESDATMGVRLRRKSLSAEFAGMLSHGTVGRILPGSPVRRGWVRGKFEADVRLDQPALSTARGVLDGRDLLIPLPGREPLAIETVSLQARGNTVRIGPSSAAWMDQRFSVSGDLRFVEGGARLDLDLASDNVDVDKVLAGLAPEKSTRPPGEAPAGPEAGAPGGRVYDFPVSGSLRLKAERLQWGRFAWSPFSAGIALSPARVIVSVSDAALCGIATPGTLSFARGDVAVDFDLAAANEEIGPALVCLTGKRYGATGRFTFRGHVAGRGAPAAIARSLAGDFEFDAAKGRIHRFNLLSKILAVVNVTEVFRGRVPDLGAGGFAYNSIRAGGTLENGKIQLKRRARVDGASMGILARGSVDVLDGNVDMVALVAPLRTIDAIIRKIPVVRYILRGSLVSIPVAIRGNVDDPEITVLPASEVGTEMLNLLERILKSPVKIIEPVIGGPQKGRSRDRHQ